MDVEGLSSQHFSNWNEAFVHYAAHYHRGCLYILLPSPDRPATPPPNPPSSSTKSPRKKKSKMVKSSATISSQSRHHPPCCSSSSSGANYHSLYNSDDPVPPALAVPVPHLSAAPLPEYFFPPGVSENPITVTSNLPTPVANQDTSKRHKKLQGPGFAIPDPITPTPASTHAKSDPCIKSGPSVTNADRPIVYVCDCLDKEGSYPMLCGPLKHKATTAFQARSNAFVATKSSVAVNAALSSHNQPIEILTDSEAESGIPPLPSQRVCKCFPFPLQTCTSPLAAEPDLDPDHTTTNMDNTPEVPHF